MPDLHLGFDEAQERLNAYLARRGLRQTRQREAILECFLACEAHVTSEELHERVRKSHPEVGAATVYRTLKLLVEAGLARASTFHQGVTVYERSGEHHDHLICLGCGEILEFECLEIEKLQGEIAQQYGYRLTRHRHHLFGYCSRCGASASGSH